MPLGKRVWEYSDLSSLNVVCNPVWVFSCATHKLLWANRACLQQYGWSLDKWLSYRFSKASTDQEGLGLLLQQVRSECEIGGGELVLPGDAAAALPGVIPYPEQSDFEFHYQQVLLHQPDSDTKLCTLVQARPVIRPAGTNRSPGKQSLIKVSLDIQPRTHTHLSSSPSQTGVVGSPTTYSQSLPIGRISPDKMSRPSILPPLSMAAILDLVESILAGQAVSQSQVESLHQMLVRGELVIQGQKFGEELLVVEELDQDVGLNLLQLLGSGLRGPGGAADDSDEPFGPLSTQQSAAVSVADESYQCDSPQPPARRSHGGSLIVNRSHGSQVGFIGVPPLPDEDDDDSNAQPCNAQGLLASMEVVLATVDDWRFDAFKLAEATGGHPMSALGFYLIMRSGLIESLQLDGPALARFLRKIEDSYPDNPYHNKTHSADVLQSMHVLMTRGGLLRRLGDDTPLLMLAGYLGAVIHDNEHRGLNNDFLVRVSDDLALTYNDASPMENHHVAAAFRLARRPSYNFMRRMSRERVGRLRKLLIDMVLGTDMKQHFNILAKFQAKLQVKLRSNTYQPGSSSNTSESITSRHSSDDGPLVEEEADRSLVMQVALKCADVGHLAAPWDVHLRWVSGLEEEFFRQGDREKAAHLTVSPLMDRTKDGITKSQVGFFEIVSIPLFSSWAAVFHEAMPMLRAAEDNCNRWRLLEAGRGGHTHVSK